MLVVVSGGGWSLMCLPILQLAAEASETVWLEDEFFLMGFGPFSGVNC